MKIYIYNSHNRYFYIKYHEWISVNVQSVLKCVLYQFAYFQPQIKILNSSIVDKKKKQQIRNNKK